MIENLEYSQEWLIKKMLEAKFKEKKNDRPTYIKISEYQLFKLVLDFLNINRKCDNYESIS